MADTGRIEALDGLRGAAAIAVLLSHAHVPFASGGFIGVDIFFVLSGFVITRLLLTEVEAHGRIVLLQFYIRRFTRLTPALAVMLAAFLLAAPLAWPGINHGRAALFAGIYLTDYAIPFGWGVSYLGHTWSLAIEEQYYLLWPLLLPLFIRRPWLLIGLFVAVSAWRWSLPFTHAYHRFDAHSTGLMLGSLAAIWQLRGRGLLGPAALALLTLLATTTILRSPVMTWTIMAAELGALALIMGLQAPGPVTSLFASRTMVWLGGLSYSLYLWHYPITAWLNGQVPWYVTAPVALALSIGLAWLSGRFVEDPCRRWGAGLAERVRTRCTAAGPLALADG